MNFEHMSTVFELHNAVLGDCCHLLSLLQSNVRSKRFRALRKWSFTSLFSLSAPEKMALNLNYPLGDNRKGESDRRGAEHSRSKTNQNFGDKDVILLSLKLSITLELNYILIETLATL